MRAIVRNVPLGAVLVVLLGVVIYEARQVGRLNRENRLLLAEKDSAVEKRDDALKMSRRATHAAPRLPAPAVSLSRGEPAADLPLNRRLFALIMGEPPKLTGEQIESFLKANHRNGASLLAMTRITGDKSYLKEAMEKFPGDPRVAFDAVRMSETPEERRQWLDQFKANAPDNALAGYLSAREYFKSGQTDRAVQELTAAAAKPQFTDYISDFALEGEEAWRAAGYSEAEARVLGDFRLPLPHVAQLKQLHQDVLDLASAYRQAGDETSAQAALQYNLLLAQQLGGSATDPLISQIVARAIQRDTYGAFDPNAPCDESGRTFGQLKDQLEQQRATLTARLDYAMDTLQFAMTPQDWITYSDRTKSLGELSAMQWLMDKYDPAPLQSFWDGEQLVPVNSVSRPVSAWLAANHGEMPTDPAQVLPFAETADERAALERLIHNIPAMSDEERAALRNHAARLSPNSSGSR